MLSKDDKKIKNLLESYLYKLTNQLLTHDERLNLIEFYIRHSTAPSTQQEWLFDVLCNRLSNY